MARKKQEVALQLEIGSQEEWEELMQKEGLIVVDAFQDWCGPCKAVINFFRRIKNEIGDDMLHFATAKCDTIDSLDKYRGRCEPCFLIYGGGSLVSVIRGANPPALEEIIKSKLEEEHKVIKGEIERKEIKDPYLADMDVEEKVQKSDKEEEEVDQEITLALIKPDVVKAGKVEEIVSKINERGIQILAQQERNLTEEEARSFYHHMDGSEFFENLIKFLTSGPSFVLVLAKGDEGIIHEFRELIGPKVFEEAKENAPESFRAVYGTNSIENAIHAAEDKESALRELAFFFPDFVPPKIARKKQEVGHQQRTLALIRPAAFDEFKESILEKIKASGFQISMQREVKLNKEEAEIFYKDHKGQPFFEELTTEMSKGTLLALALEKQNAISGFRGILGPKDVEKAKENDPSSLRAQFSKEDVAINLIHGSDSEESAQNELKYFFPVEQTVAAIKPDGVENREEIISMIKEARFKVVKTVDMVMTKELAEEFYADQRDQEYFDDLITHMQSGPTLFMVLSREDAVRGWRSMMGPKDPNIAAESYPDSIRSVYGKDIKENAVYGSADTSEVWRVMKVIFGKLEFSEDGSLLPEYVTSEEEETPKHEEVAAEDKEAEISMEVQENVDDVIPKVEPEADLEGGVAVDDDANKPSEEAEVAEPTRSEAEHENDTPKASEVEIESAQEEKTEIILENSGMADMEEGEPLSNDVEERSGENADNLDTNLNLSEDKNQSSDVELGDNDASLSHAVTSDINDPEVLDEKTVVDTRDDETRNEKTSEVLEESSEKNKTEIGEDIEGDTNEQQEDVTVVEDTVVSEPPTETMAENSDTNKEDVNDVTVTEDQEEETTMGQGVVESKKSEDVVKESERDETVAEGSEAIVESDRGNTNLETVGDNTEPQGVDAGEADNTATAADVDAQ